MMHIFMKFWLLQLLSLWLEKEKIEKEEEEEEGEMQKEQFLGEISWEDL